MLLSEIIGKRVKITKDMQWIAAKNTQNRHFGTVKSGNCGVVENADGVVHIVFDKKKAAEGWYFGIGHYCKHDRYGQAPEYVEVID